MNAVGPVDCKGCPSGTARRLLHHGCSGGAKARTGGHQPARRIPARCLAPACSYDVAGAHIIMLSSYSRALLLRGTATSWGRAAGAASKRQDSGGGAAAAPCQGQHSLPRASLRRLRQTPCKVFQAHAAH